MGFIFGVKLTEQKKGFFAQVTEGGKITIPHEIRTLIGVEKGDMVKIPDIRKVEPGEVE